MNMRFPSVIAFLLLLVSNNVSAQYIQVDDTYTAQQLVEDILVNSSCATVSNISVSGGNFTDGSQSYGFFSGAGTTFPFQSGVVLSTGRAAGTEGPNASLLDDGGGMSWNGDPDLEDALSLNNSVNATVLEFDFVPLGNKISFRYMLSSEEYHDTAPCQYSDGFAFLLTQTGSSAYTNLAVIPGTTIPVKVTSVHPDIPGACPAQNAQYFGAFNGYEHPTNFNGQTAVMQAQANVTPGVQYHIKLVIADEGNYRYDSAIFLGGGSFEVVTDLGPDRTIAAQNPLCPGENLTLDATSQGATGYQWYHNGSSINGATGPTLFVDTEGTYTVDVHLSGTCTSQGEINIEYATPPAQANQTLLQCDEDNDGITSFNLELAIPALTDDNGLYNVIFYTTQSDADAGINQITNPQTFQNTTANQQVVAWVANQFGCHTTSIVTLSTSAQGLNNPLPLEECDIDGIGDGFYTFDLTARDTDILQNLPAGLQLQYFTSGAAALQGTQPIANPAAFTNTTAGAQTVFARVYNGADCYGIAELQLIVHSFGASLQDETITLCQGDLIFLTPGSGFTSYTWNTNPEQATESIPVTLAGTYSVTVTNIFGCEGTKTFTVVASSPAVDATVAVNDFAGTANSVIITPQGLGDYEFSLDGFTYWNTNVFTNLLPGEYIIHIRDKNGCGPVFSKNVFVLDYPRFFTPNGDGVNDVWRIPFLESYPDTLVTIFDRYGKVVKQFKGYSNGWDGTYNGARLPSTDYWFEIQTQDGRIIKGHFAMMR